MVGPRLVKLSSSTLCSRSVDWLTAAAPRRTSARWRRGRGALDPQRELLRLDHEAASTRILSRIYCRYAGIGGADAPLQIGRYTRYKVGAGSAAHMFVSGGLRRCIGTPPPNANRACSGEHGAPPCIREVCLGCVRGLLFCVWLCACVPVSSLCVGSGPRVCPDRG